MESNNKTLNIQDIYRLEEEIDTIIDEEINNDKTLINNSYRPMFNINDICENNIHQIDIINYNSAADTNSELPTYEIEINGETYFVTDQTPSFIFERDENDPETIGEHVGIYENEVAYLITTHKGKKVYISMETGDYHKYISDTEIGDVITN
jgi:hypothetical protein